MRVKSVGVSQNAAWCTLRAAAEKACQQRDDAQPRCIQGFKEYVVIEGQVRSQIRASGFQGRGQLG